MVQQRRPDIVGLQEVGRWRRGPLNLDAGLEQKPAATEVDQDFLKILCKEVNAGEAQCTVADVRDECNFEVSADVDGKPTTDLYGADGDYRPTMRDPVLIRQGRGIQVKDVRGKHYAKKNSFTGTVGGRVTLTSLPGWQAMGSGSAKDGGSRRQHPPGGVQRPDRGAQGPRPAAPTVRRRCG